ncbi:hypothetical protein AC1031_014643 [Aphanomyces cochlioides]|nr:hypothetical protein AC1031_014643 [Aphanomyces cochlioides]
MPSDGHLPTNYFDCPPLSQREKNRFVEIGRQSMRTLVNKAKLKGGTYDWKLLKDEAELKIYKGRSHGSSDGSVLHCGVMEMVAELEENMELHRYDTTEQAREYVRRFVGSYADVITLDTPLPRHPDRPYDCIKLHWFLAKSPLDGLISRRDFVVLESDMETQIDGKRAWVRSYHSVELDAIPDMRKELNCIRGYMYDTGFVVVESDRPGYLSMTYLSDVDIKGNVPTWAHDHSLKFYLRSMNQIDRCMRENRLSRTPFLSRDELCPLSLRSSCALCHRKFGPLRKKTNCFKCGEVVCRACNRLWNVNVNGLDAKVRACVTCSLSSTVAAPKTKRTGVSYVSVTPIRSAHLSSTAGWSMEDDFPAHVEAIPIDLTSNVDSTFAPTAQTIILDTPSMYQSSSLYSQPQIQLDPR